MEVVSLSLVPVGSLVWQPRPGAWMLTIACKATFELRHLESPFAPEQEPIRRSDRHWSDDPSWSLYAPSDLVPQRPRADVVVVGHAFSPGGAPVHSLTARLIVGRIDKSIRIYGDRSFTQDGVLVEGLRFTKMPLVWERAGGGPGTSNPVGMAPDVRNLYGRRDLPNLQPPGAVVTGPEDVIEPIGFGPIAPGWPSRREKLGRSAEAWRADDWHRHPLPADVDVTYFNVAPRDQQATVLRDNERIILENLHPEHPHFVTSLPGRHPRAYVDRPGKAPQGVPMRPDLLWINTDLRVCTMTWRGQIPLGQPHEAGHVLVAMEEPGQTLAWRDVERLAGRTAAWLAGERVQGGAAPTRGAAHLAPALDPWQPGGAGLQGLGDHADHGETVVLSGDDLEDQTATGTVRITVPGADLPFAAAPASQPALPASPAHHLAPLPFVRAAAAPPPPAAPGAQAPRRATPLPPMTRRDWRAAAAPLAAQRTGSAADTVTASLISSTQALPFRPRAPVPQEDADGEDDMPTTRGAQPVPLPPLAPARVPDEVQRPPLVAMPLGLSPAPPAPARNLAPPAPAPPAPARNLAPPPAPEPPAPPPLIGPLAKPDMAAADPPAVKAPEPEVKASAPEPPAAPAEPAPPSAAYPIERCAAIAARLAHRPAERDAVLEAEKLTPEPWQSMHEQRLAEIQAELGRGRKKLLSAYDTAYVAALEERRGPITAGDYARLVIAAERGNLDAALKELDLPEETMMPIRRVWLERIVKDTKAAAEVRAAMRVAAEG